MDSYLDASTQDQGFCVQLSLYSPLFKPFTRQEQEGWTSIFTAIQPALHVQEILQLLTVIKSLHDILHISSTGPPQNPHTITEYLLC